MSSVKVEFLSLLSDIIDEDDLEIHIQNNSTLIQLIRTMSDRYGEDFRNKVLDDKGNLLNYILLAINGNQITTTNKNDVLIQDGDQISFIPAIAGG